MAGLTPSPKQQFTNAAGVPLVGGKLYSYDAGTANPRATYSDAGGTIPNTNPVILDGRGEATVFLAAVPYKLELRDALNNLIWTQDNVSTFGGSDLTGTGGSGLIGFSYAVGYGAGTIGKWLKDLALNTGAGFIGWIAAGVNAVTRTVQSKLRDVVSVKDFGAVGDGVTDDTAAIQNALNSGAKAVFVPAGSYKCSGLLMPNLFGFVLYGEGPASTLVMKNNGQPCIKWDQTAMVYNEQTVRAINVDGTVGTNHGIDCSGAGGVTLEDLYVTNVPVGFAGVFLNGCAGTYAHDQRIRGLQIYSNTAGHSGIRCGSLCSDANVLDFIMNGNFLVNYCMYFDLNALTTTVADSHPYNASISVIGGAGGNKHLAFNGCTLDNATSHIVQLPGATNIGFTDCFFEAIKAGKHGLYLTASAQAVSLVNCRFEGAVGAASCVTADNTTTNILVTGGDISNALAYAKPFDLQGPYSSARGIGGWNPFGMQWSFSFASATALANGATQYMGITGLQNLREATEYSIPKDSKLGACTVAVHDTPAAGQTYTFSVEINAVQVGASLVVSNGQFGGTIDLSGNSVSANDRFTLKCVASATPGPTYVRGHLDLTA